MGKKSPGKITRALALALALADAARGATRTADGRTCAWPLRLDSGAVAFGCVPHGDTGVTWCVAEEDGRWGVCADAVDAREVGDVAVRETMAAAATLAEETSSARARAEAMEVLDRASVPLLRSLASENVEIRGTLVANPIAEYLARRGLGGDARAEARTRLSPAPPPLAPAPPPPAPSPPFPSPPRASSTTCVVKTDVRWESPQADGSKEFGMDVYVVLTSSESITDGWKMYFKFMSDDVALLPNSEYGADARALYAPESGRVFELRDRGWDAYFAAQSTRRIGFNVRTKAGRWTLVTKTFELNGARCDIIRG